MSPGLMPMRLSITTPASRTGIGCRTATAHRTDDAGKLHQHAVAGGLDQTTAVLDDLRIKKLAAQRFEAFEGAAFIGADQPRIARHIGREDRRQPTSLAHPGSPIA